MRRAASQLRARTPGPATITAVPGAVTIALAELLDVCARASDESLDAVDGPCDCPICLALPQAQTIAGALLGTNDQETS